MRIIADNSLAIKRLLVTDVAAELDVNIRYPEICDYTDFNTMFCNMVTVSREVLTVKALRHLENYDVPKAKKMLEINTKIIQLFAAKMDGSAKSKPKLIHLLKIWMSLDA